MVQKAKEMAQGRDSECREKEEEGSLAAVTFLSLLSNHTLSLFSETVLVQNGNISFLKLSVNMQDEPLRKKYTEQTLQITYCYPESQNNMENFLGFNVTWKVL